MPSGYSSGKLLCASRNGMALLRKARRRCVGCKDPGAAPLDRRRHWLAAAGHAVARISGANHQLLHDNRQRDHAKVDDPGWRRGRGTIGRSGLPEHRNSRGRQPPALAPRRSPRGFRSVSLQ